LYASPDIVRVIISRRVRWTGHVALMRDEKCIQLLVGKSDGKRPFGEPRHRWEDNIRMDLREIVWNGVDWMHLAQDRVQRRAGVNTVMNLWLL
jgi:hypothetical protein